MIGEPTITNLDTLHPMLEARVQQFAKMRDFAEGAHAVKSKQHKELKTYLAHIGHQGDGSLYSRFFDGSTFPEETKSAIKKNRNILFGCDPKFLAPGEDPMAFYNGLVSKRSDFVSFTKNVATELITMGRVGIFASLDSKGEPKVRSYDCEDIINWSFTTEGELQWVVLKEQRRYFESDGVTSEYDCQYRVLWFQMSIDEEGTITSDPMFGVYVRDEKEKKKFILIESGPLLDIQGYPLSDLPFWILTDSGDPEDVNGPPLSDLVELNHSLYVKMAIAELAIWYAGVPSTVITGAKPTSGNSDRVDLDIQLAVGDGITLNQGGEVKYVSIGSDQVKAVMLPMDTIQDKIRVASNGLLDVQKGLQIEGSDTHRLRKKGEYSQLEAMSVILSRKLTDVARFIGMNYGGVQDVKQISVEFERNFLEERPDPQYITALGTLVNSGTISYRMFFENMQRAHEIPEDRTYEEEWEELQKSRSTFVTEKFGIQPEKVLSNEQ